uniref:Amine oxidase domain-containing protein n=1 Tax=Lactuca sativa TaxID=4236 RepID=A0A9R1X7Y3_LACSA|nr:hypothetical protein LSAT_V11C600323370 [Lactuca sativa]
MCKRRVAVVGAGISGLVSAYVASTAGVEVVLYEKEEYLGGHAKTVTIDGVDLDLGFMVFNRVTYPNMIEFFETLGVDIEISDMSFSVSLDEGNGCEWGSRNGLSGLFAQKRNVLNPYFWKMIREITKFKDDVLRYLEELENNQDLSRNETLGDFLKSHGYSELFQNAYLVPVCSSIWSCPAEGVKSFSAFSVLSFCRNHHLLQVREELEKRGCQIRMGCIVQSITKVDNGCEVVCKDGSRETYSDCIMATHAPETLKMLGEEATHEERRILGAFNYVYSDIFLHRDKSLMPQNPSAWSSWNFLGTVDNKVCLTYWLNVLQNIDDKGPPFLVTLNPPRTPKHTMLKWTTGHPIPSVAASKASLELNQIQGKRGIWFCGAYQGYGFHEDGLKAGMLAANGMLSKSCEILKDPKHMVPSLMETGARFFVASLLEEGGTMFTFEGTRKKSNFKVYLKVHNPQFYWKIATKADLGLADAYINGDFSFVDKKEGLLNMFMSNELFALFLDDTMTYSCAIFKNEDEDLKTAQMRKISSLIEKARVDKEHKVLEIGCGWGTLAIELVKRTGCKYTGITLSEEQLKYAETKVKEAGLQDKIRFVLCDYRQLPHTYKYDRIISCLDHQFISIPDRRYDEYRRSSDFIKEYIFPGGCLPSLSRVTSAMVASSGLCVEQVENIGIHYYQTLRYWRKNFMEKQSKILALGFNQKFIRTWEYYFDYCAAGFKTHTLGDHQVVFSRPGNIVALGDPYKGIASAYSLN